MIAAATRRWPVGSFILLTFWLTGAGWAMLLHLNGPVPIEALFEGPSNITLIYLSAGAPSLIALILTAVQDGRAGLAEIGKRFVRIRAPIPLWIAALGLPVLIQVLAASFLPKTFGAPVLPPWYQLIPLSVLPLLFAGPLCEEIGWRGYLQPQLLKRYGAVRTAITIGLIWCFWHLPLSYTPGTTPPLNDWEDWAQYAASAIASSAIMLVLVVAARGSIAIAVAYHWASNAAAQIAAPLYPKAPTGAWETVSPIRLGLMTAAAVVALALIARRQRRI